MTFARLVVIRTPDDDSNSKLIVALCISMMLHTLFLLVIPAMEERFEPEEQLIEVTLRQEPKLQTPVAPRIKEQIVSPPELPPVKAPPDTNLKSEINAKTEREQLKRGETLNAKTPPPQPKSQPKAQQPKEQPTAAEKARDLSHAKLTLNDDALAALAAKPSQQPSTSKVTALRQLSDYSPFSRQSFTPQNILRGGTPDFLPKIPDGEITLLNTKADLFAVFVRRVASQVFGKVRQFQWQSIPAGEVRKIDDFVTVEAIMSPAGKLLGVKLLDGSGSAPFDRMIVRSAEEGVSDLNPPPGAVSDDGNIHFVFRSRCWTRPAMGRLPESRWLLLATGLL